jgi:hypothetical protein
MAARHVTSPVSSCYNWTILIIFTPNSLWRWNSVPKRRHMKFRSRGITQKKANNRQAIFRTESYRGQNVSHVMVDRTIKCYRGQKVSNVAGKSIFTKSWNDMQIWGTVKCDVGDWERQSDTATQPAVKNVYFNSKRLLCYKHMKWQQYDTKWLPKRREKEIIFFIQHQQFWKHKAP